MKSTLIKFAALVLALTGLVGITALSTTPVFADTVCSSNAAPAVKRAAGCSGYGTDDQLPYVIVNIIYAVIAIAGLIAVVFVIIGGVQYMTSSGDPGKVEKAKKTILYAIVGLIICALAFAIVNFVINNIIFSGTN